MVIYMGLSSSFCMLEQPIEVIKLKLVYLYFCRGEYGVWAAFLALIARLFFTFPGS